MILDQEVWASEIENVWAFGLVSWFSLKVQEVLSSMLGIPLQIKLNVENGEGMLLN